MNFLCHDDKALAMLPGMSSFDCCIDCQEICLLRDVDNNDLEIALKGSNEEVKSVVLQNLSKRLAAMIEEDIEFMGPVRMKDVEEAQQKIVAIIRKLEDSAEIVISRGGGDEVIV